jgi:hypothetical protein
MTTKDRPMDLSSRLLEPFSPDDIEWRVSQTGIGNKGIWVKVLAYITARAVMARLDEVCGCAYWRTEPAQIIEVNGKTAFQVGISLCLPSLDYEWVTKWDVAEPTNIEPAKGGFSGAMKRAGAQWGVGRYLYRLTETFAEVAESSPGRHSEWNWAKTKDGTHYWWKNPELPAWALPKEPEHEISSGELNDLKRYWRDKFAADEKSPRALRNGFATFVRSIVGEFPSDDSTCWTRDAWEKCQARIDATESADGVSADVPFEE